MNIPNNIFNLVAKDNYGVKNFAEDTYNDIKGILGFGRKIQHLHGNGRLKNLIYDIHHKHIGKGLSGNAR